MKTSQSAPDAELFDRYFIGECTPDEIRHIQTWAAQFPNSQDALKALRRMRASDVLSPWNIDEQWASMARRLKHDERTGKAATFSGIPNGQSPFTRGWLSSPWRTLMFGVLGCIAIGFGWFTVRSGNYHTDVSNQASVYTTANGERATITLPDGSRAALNVASQLEVPADYANGNRTLRLTGEAVFTVSHRPGNAFTVIAGPSITKVLGTRFVVRHYPADTAAIVAVQDGKVSVHSTVVTAFQELSVTANHVTPIRTLNASRFRFIDGVLVLNGMRLQDAIPELNRWLDADIRLADPALEDRLIGGEYTQGSISNLVESLELTFDVRVIRNGRVLTLYPRG